MFSKLTKQLFTSYSSQVQQGKKCLLTSFLLHFYLNTNCALHSPESRKFFRAAENSSDYSLRVTESLEDLSVQVVTCDDISSCLPGLWELRSDLLVLKQRLQEREVHQLQQASNCLFLPHFINNWEGWIHKAQGDSARAKTDHKEDNSPPCHQA